MTDRIYLSTVYLEFLSNNFIILLLKKNLSYLRQIRLWPENCQSSEFRLRIFDKILATCGGGMHPNYFENSPS